MTTFINLQTKQTLSVDLTSLIRKSTTSLYIRKGFLNGNLFLSQRGNGAYGAGDVCSVNAELVEVNDKLFNRISILASK